MKIYFLSGLGADSRVFQYLNFPAEHERIFINWLSPKEKETLQEYAKRIAALIDDSNPFILIGLSFGGIVAAEVLEFVTPEKTILISSAANSNEIPVLYKIAGSLKLNRLMPSRLAKKANALTYKMFGVTTEENRKLLRDILKDTDPVFFKWAVDRLINWKRKVSENSMIRIHGSNDKILPVINFIPKYLIEDGGHLMILDKADEISAIITKEIS